MAEYIEREAAIRVASGYCHPANIAKELSKLPAADVRPVVRGRWKRNERGNYNCSNCKSEHNAVFGFNFCPNCGADMREES